MAKEKAPGAQSAEEVAPAQLFETAQPQQKVRPHGQGEVLPPAVMAALVNVRPEDLVSSSPYDEVVKGNTQRSSCWMKGPANVKFLAIADQRLSVVAGMDGKPANKVERVHVHLIRGTKCVVIKPAPASDLSAIPVLRHAGSAGCWINLDQLLVPEGLVVESGYKEKFDVAFVPKASPLWPGLVIDCGNPQARRKITAAKKAVDQAPMSEA